MSDNNSEENQVILSISHVRQWQEDRSRLADEIRTEDAKTARLRAELSRIDERLKAAAAFIPWLQDWIDTEEEKQMGPEGVALTDAIKKVLAAHGGRTVPREVIKTNLPGIGGFQIARLNANPNYFYTALKRLVARTEIEEGPTGQFRLKPAPK